MKKKYTLIGVIITVVLVIVGYFAYSLIVQSNYLANPSQTIDVKLDSMKEFELIKPETGGSPFSIEITLEGTAQGIFHMNISNSDGKVHEIGLKGQDIDYIYKGDWYSDTCFLLIEPDAGTQVDLSLEYRFLTLD